MEHEKVVVTCDFNSYNEITIDDNSKCDLLCLKVSSEFNGDVLIKLTRKDASILAKRLNQFASKRG